MRRNSCGDKEIRISEKFQRMTKSLGNFASYIFQHDDVRFLYCCDFMSTLKDWIFIESVDSDEVEKKAWKWFFFQFISGNNNNRENLEKIMELIVSFKDKKLRS